MSLPGLRGYHWLHVAPAVPKLLKIPRLPHRYQQLLYICTYILYTCTSAPSLSTSGHNKSSQTRQFLLFWSYHLFHLPSRAIPQYTIFFIFQYKLVAFEFLHRHHQYSATRTQIRSLRRRGPVTQINPPQTRIMIATRALRQAAVHAERTPLIKFIGPRSIPCE